MLAITQPDYARERTGGRTRISGIRAPVTPRRYDPVMLDLDPTVVILGTGSALPERRVTNAELEGMISNYDTTSGDFSLWVDRVTHIQERRFADPETESSGTLGLAAARRAIEAAGMQPSDVEHMLFCSFTGRSLFPGDHAWIVRELGLEVGTVTLAARHVTSTVPPPDPISIVPPIGCPSTTRSLSCMYFI